MEGRLSLAAIVRNVAVVVAVEGMMMMATVLSNVTIVVAVVGRMEMRIMIMMRIGLVVGIHMVMVEVGVVRHSSLARVFLMMVIPVLLFGMMTSSWPATAPA